MRLWLTAASPPPLVQTVEQQKFSSALERQRRELDAVLEERLSSELGRQHRQVELRHRQQLEALQTELENEMRQQLRRQAAAHSDHLQVRSRPPPPRITGGRPLEPPIGTEPPPPPPELPGAAHSDHLQLQTPPPPHHRGPHSFHAMPMGSMLKSRIHRCIHPVPSSMVTPCAFLESASISIHPTELKVVFISHSHCITLYSF